MRVEFGNDKAIETTRDEDGNEIFRKDPGQHVTTMEIPDDMPIAEAFTTLTNPERGALSKHIQPGETPAWIESDNELLLALLQNHYGTTKTRPKSWGKK